MNIEFNSKHLRALYDVCNTINSHLDMNEVLQSIMDVTTDIMNVEASSLVLRDESNDELNFYITEGKKAKTIKQIKMKSGEGIVGYVIEKGEPALVNDVSEDTRFYEDADKKSGFVTKSLLCAPIISEKETIGAIEVINKIDNTDFNKMDLKFLNIIAGQSSIAIHNAKLHEQIVKNERLTAIGQTITGLAHSIKNVLQGVDAGKYFLQKGLKKQDFSTLHKGWDYINDNTSFIKELVLDMLTFSKERKPVYEKTDINYLIESTSKLFIKKAQKEGSRIILKLDNNIEGIEVDQMGIKRCILNLITNALDAISEIPQGKIVIKTNQFTENNVQIHVIDNGMGIEQKDIKKLFKIFYSTKGAKGTGLGLTVTKKIIDEHNGKIEVNSVRSKGTEFLVTLPLRKEAKASEDINKHTSSKILVIDSDKEDMESITDLLNGIDVFSIKTALDDYEGLVKAEEFQPNLIILKKDRRNMKSHALLKNLKNKPETSNIPVLIIYNKNSNFNYEDEQLKNMYNTIPAEILEEPLKTNKFKEKIINILER